MYSLKTFLNIILNFNNNYLSIKLIKPKKKNKQTDK